MWVGLCVYQIDVRVGAEYQGVYMVCVWWGVSVCMCVVGDKKR